MKTFIVFFISLISVSINAQMNCNLPANIGGIQFCPNTGYKTCEVNVTNAGGVPESRVFCLSIPSDPGIGITNAIFMFPGGDNTGVDVANLWINQKDTAFMVIPNAQVIGSSRRWNTVDDLIPHFDDLESATGYSDTDFISLVLLALDAEFSCDGSGFTTPCINNYYAAGFSSGAAMVFQLYTRNEFNQWFNGYGAVSNRLNPEKRATYNMGAGIGNATMPIEPRPIFFMMGTEERINMPFDFMIDTIRGLCPQPDFIHASLQCFSNVAGQNVASNRYDTGLWLRQQNTTVQDYPTVIFHDLPTDDTLIASRIYAKDPSIINSQAVSVSAVINGAHFWPSINNQSPDKTHSEDIETSDEMVRFWVNEAGYTVEQDVIFVHGFE